jgi:hypothetical protein
MKRPTAAPTASRTKAISRNKDGDATQQVRSMLIADLKEEERRNEKKKERSHIF